MRIGEARGRSRRQRGVTYLLLLFTLAITGTALAAAGSLWSTAAQRGREAELVFRGEAIQRAIASYARHAPDGQPAFPATLDDLLEDRRALVIRRHLRQLYADPFTGRADWAPVLEGGRIRGVHSRSTASALRVRAGQSGEVAGAVSEWLFVVTPDDVAAPAAGPPPPSFASAPP